jgi:hypothetical protein
MTDVYSRLKIVICILYLNQNYLSIAEGQQNKKALQWQGLIKFNDLEQWPLFSGYLHLKLLSEYRYPGNHVQSVQYCE